MRHKPEDTAPHDTRGAQKMRAALAMFDVAARIRNARAIDIGASTGGFTTLLLEHGAQRVVAVDVGHGQLLPSLREDPRVELHEKTDFRRASLDIAPGPFSFFTVDVSFVAARNMLRSLAFRLEPGAHGIVLIKPQFELSKGELREGEGTNEPRLRKRAVELVREKAERTGFRVLDVRDSAVTGESGTVELLALLVFDGRPEAFPEPGEKKPVAPPKKKGERAVRVDATAELEWFAIAAPGVEPLLAAELNALASHAKIRDVHALAGGVSFRAPLLGGYAANLASRLATRVVLRLGAEKAREFALLRRKLHAMPFERVIAPGSAVRIDVTTRHCRLYHTKAIAETVELGIADRLRAPIVRVAPKSGEASDDDDEPELQQGREAFARLLVRGVDDVFTISIDSSGELLHRRGGREEQGAAPMRETLAAALLAHAGYTGDEPLIDAMCGSGTLALEAAQIAGGLLPGGRRGFAIESFAGVKGDALVAEKARLQAALLRARSAPVAAFDRDRKMIEIARRNAERIGIAEHIAFQQIDVRDATAPFESGLVVCNPPYGKRLGKSGEIKLLYRAIGHALRGAFARFRVAIVVPRSTPEVVLGLRVQKRVELQNGGVPITLYVGTPEP
jgi:putative N6-adenine-specific DNA methylase